MAVTANSPICDTSRSSISVLARGKRRRHDKNLSEFPVPLLHRAVYTVKFAEAVFVLHCFQKKSKSEIATPKVDMGDIIRARLKMAEALAQELRNAKTDH